MSTRGPTDVGTSTNMSHRTGKAVQMHTCDNNDWSSLGPKYGAKNNTGQLSEDSDELSENPSDVRESDKDLTSSLPEAMHMACMRDHHHYIVYRDRNDGKGPSQNNISYNGIYRDNDSIHWAYEEEFIECSNLIGCGSPVKNH
jgi:hypothetical protein